MQLLQSITTPRESHRIPQFLVMLRVDAPGQPLRRPSLRGRLHAHACRRAVIARFQRIKRKLIIVAGVLAALGAQPSRSQVNSSGAYSMDIAFEAPQYRGIEPGLAIRYNSLAGNGPVGVGWTLSGLSEIRRVSQTLGAPALNGTDRFLLDGLELIPCIPATAATAKSPSCKYAVSAPLLSYTARIETYERIAFDPTLPGGAWFVWNRSGVKQTYLPARDTPSWLISTVVDPLGNRVEYNYSNIGTNSASLLDHVDYNQTHIQFYWETRPDVMEWAVGTNLISLDSRLKTVDVLVEGQRARTFSLEYSVHPTTNRSILTRLERYGKDASISPAGEVSGQALPAAELAYNGVPTVSAWTGKTEAFGIVVPHPSGGQANVYIDAPEQISFGNSLEFHSADVDGDGRADGLFVGAVEDSSVIGSGTAASSVPATLVISTRLASQQWIITRLPFDPAAHWDNSAWQDGRPELVKTWVADVNGDGVQDLIVVGWRMLDPSQPDGLEVRLRLATALGVGDGTFVWAPGGFQDTTWLTPTLWGYQNIFPEQSPQCVTGDFNGDGRQDFACAFQDGESKQFLAYALARKDGSFQVNQPLQIADDPGTQVPMPLGATSFLPFETRRLTVGDVNRDGLDDLELLDLKAADVSSCALLGDPTVFRSMCNIGYEIVTYISDGSEFNPQRFTTPWSRQDYLHFAPASMLSVDLNGDGRADLALIQGQVKADGAQSLNGIATATMGRDGTFSFASQPIPASLAVPDLLFAFGDADGDGRTDLMVAVPVEPGRGVNCSSATFERGVFTVAKGLGSGTFALPQRWDDCATGTEMTSSWAIWMPQGVMGRLQIADTDGDGLMDFLLPTLEFPSPGNANARVYDLTSPTSSMDGHRWMEADVAGVGQSDFMYVNRRGGGNVAQTLRETGGEWLISQFVLPSFENSSVSTWKIADVNRDGRADIIHLESIDVGTKHMTQIDVCLANPTSQFSCLKPSFSFEAAAGLVLSAWRLGDVDGDGRPDLVQEFVTSPPGMGPSLFIKTLRADGSGGWIEDPVAGPIATSFPSADYLGTRRSWRIADVDGDGRDDLVQITSTFASIRVTSLMFRSAGNWAATTAVIDNPDIVGGWGAVPGADSDLPWHVVDANGDGIADLVRQLPFNSGVLVETLLGLGNGQFVAKVSFPALPDMFVLPLTPGTVDWYAIDVNGDGLTDLIQVEKYVGSARANILYSSGDGQWSAEHRVISDALAFESSDVPGWQAVNFDGDGIPSLAHILATGSPSHPTVSIERISFQTARDKIKSYQLNDATIEIRYSGASTFAVSDPGQGCGLPASTSFQVVSKILINDGRRISGQSSFSYECPKWSHRTHELLGWTKVSMSQPAVSNRPTVSIYRVFNQDDACLTEPVELGQLDSSGGTIGSREIVTYESPGPEAPFSCRPSHQNHIEYSSTGIPRRRQSAFTFFTYDEFGNPSSIMEEGRTQSGSPFSSRISLRRYDHATAPYIVDRLMAEEFHEGQDNSGKLLQSALYCYDGDTSTDCSQGVTQGVMTRKIDIEDHGTRATDFLHDPFGNLSSVRDANGHTSTVSHDPIEHLYPVSQVNELGQTTLSLEWDQQLGFATKVTDLNGAVSTFKYDEFGRPTFATGPTGMTVRRSYRQVGTGEREIVQKVAAPRTTTTMTTWHFDGLGRLFQIDETGRNVSELISSVVAYTDTGNLPSGISRRFLAGTTSHPEYEKYAYDAAGRLLSVTRPGGVAQLEYDIDTARNALLVTNIDEAQQRRESLVDIYGKLIETRSFDGSVMSRTRYDYDGRDQLTHIIDANGNETYFQWDLLGRQSFAFDPDLGARQPVLDDVGNLKSLTDAQNQTVMFDYDNLDRLTTKTYPNGQTVIFRYDEPGHGAGMGRLTSMSDLNAAGCPHDSSASYTYDLVGHIIGLEQCVKGLTSFMKFGYDARGLLRQVVYPDQEDVRYTYNAAGWPTAMSRYVNTVKYDIDGRPTVISFSNSVAGILGYDPKVGDLGTESFSSVTSELFNAQYTYKPNGLLATSSSTTNAMNLTFSHDSMGRLRTVTGDYRQTFTYDGVGNLLTNSALGTYTYPPQGNLGCSPNGIIRQPCPQPHGVQNAGRYRLTYDDNGLLRESLDTVSGRIRHMEWTADHLPMSVRDYSGRLTQYIYDGFGNLVQEGTPNTVTYFNPYASQSTNGLTKNYFLGSRLIAVVSGGSRLWTYTDRSGTVRAAGDDSGRPLGFYDYKAFGEPFRFSTAPRVERYDDMPVDFGNGLIPLGARFYDPKIARFLSADTIVPDVLNSQAANRYSFAYNSPLAFIDPTGHQPLWISQPYGGSPVPSPGSDSFAFDPNFRSAPGQICSACRGSRSIYATPVAVPNRANENREILNKALVDLGLTWEDLMSRVPQSAVQSIAERLNVDWLTGVPLDTEPYNFGETMFDAYANLGALQAQGLMAYDAAAAAAFSSATRAAGTSGNRPFPSKPNIGSARAPRGRTPMFNPNGLTRNCTRCVASLLDHIANEGDMVADQFPDFANAGRMDRVIEYLKDQVGVEFGERMQAPIGLTDGFGELVPGALPDGDYVIFTRLDQATNIPDHVIFGRSMGGQMWFYDPQIDVGVPFLFERYFAYPVVYPP